MNLNKTEVLVLKELANAPQKTSGIASLLGLSRGRASTVLNKLVKQNLAEKSGRTYSMGNASQAIAITRLIRNQPSLAVEKIITSNEYGILELLYKKQRTVKELSKETGKTERNVYYCMEPLKSMGLVTELGAGTYAINRKHPAYGDIEPLLSKKLATVPADLESREIDVAWSGTGEHIIRTREPGKAIATLEKAGYKWKYTSTSAASRYGIHVTPPETRLYIYKNHPNLKTESGEYAAIEDVIIHMLLERNISADKYGKWLIQLNQEKTDLSYLKEAAEKYSLSKKIDEILYAIKPTLGKVKNKPDSIRIPPEETETDIAETTGRIYSEPEISKELIDEIRAIRKDLDYIKAHMADIDSIRKARGRARACKKPGRAQ